MHRLYPCATVGEQRENSAIFVPLCHLFNTPEWISHRNLLINMQMSPDPHRPASSSMPKTKVFCTSSFCFNCVQKGAAWGVCVYVYAFFINACGSSKVIQYVHRGSRKTYIFTIMSSYTYAPVCVLNEEGSRSHRQGSCCSPIPQEEGKKLLLLCKLAFDEGFLGEAQRGFVVAVLRRMGEVRRGYGEKTGTKFPSLHPDPSCCILSLFVPFPLPFFCPSLPHIHDPVINVVEISGSLINECPPFFVLKLFSSFDCIRFRIFSNFIFYQ